MSRQRLRNEHRAALAGPLGGGGSIGPMPGSAMITPARPAKLTYRDYLLLPEDGRRHELIGGEHHVTPAPTRKHQTAVVNLTLLLGQFVRERQLGSLFVAPFDVVFSDEDVVEPDLLFVSRQRDGVIGERGVHGAPDLAIEILSKSSHRRDEVVKRDLYERTGVSEYWIVDPERQTVRIHRATLAGFRSRGELAATSGDSLASPLFPGLSFPVARIFE